MLEYTDAKKDKRCFYEKNNKHSEKHSGMARRDISSGHDDLHNHFSYDI